MKPGEAAGEERFNAVVDDHGLSLGAEGMDEEEGGGMTGLDVVSGGVRQRGEEASEVPEDNNNSVHDRPTATSQYIQ